jgi:vitamin B12 transporter
MKRALLIACAIAAGTVCAQDTNITDENRSPIVISATRTPLPLDQAPASVSVISGQELEQKQVRTVADALREVPGVSVVQTGTPGQLTSVFVRGLKSEHIQVLIDGIPINQGLSGAFDFANLTTDDIDRIEITRGPQSTISGPRALAGVVQIFTKQGRDGFRGSISAEGGSFDSFREMLSASGRSGMFDFSLGASRFDTNNDRPNNQYRLTNIVNTIGFSPNDQLRISNLFTYYLADAGNPNVITSPRPFDNLLTERWLFGPSIEYRPFEWWTHKLIYSYDQERQVNNPNEDGFVGPTRALFRQYSIDYQNDIRATHWLTITSGVFYNRVDAQQERPEVLFGLPTLIEDKTENHALFLQFALKPIDNLLLVIGGRYDHFDRFGDVYTYRLAGNYRVEKTNTVLHASLATGFSPPSSQDKIFGDNFALEPEKNKGWDIGFDQTFFHGNVTFGGSWFYNELSNVIGFDGLFRTLNLGSARTAGVELSASVHPIRNATLTASYTYLETHKTSSADISQPPGARLPRRPRNEFHLTASYLWCEKLRTTVEAKYVNGREELNFGGPNFDIEDYTVCRFAAEYEINPHLKIFGRIENLTDEKYAEVFGFPNLGRGYYCGLSLSY